MDGPLHDEVAFAVFVAALLGTGVAVAALRPHWVVRWPRSVLALLLAISGVAAVGLIRLDPPSLRVALDPSTEPLLPENDPGQALYRQAVRDFGDDEIYVVVLECDEVFTTSCLSKVEEISAPVARMREVRSLTSLMDATSFRYVPEEDWIEVRPLIDDIPEDAGLLADLRERALSDPVYRRTIVSEDSRAAAINIRFRSMTDAQLIDAQLDARVREIVERESGGNRFYISGRPHFKTHVYEGMVRDLYRLVPYGLAAMALVLGLTTGSLHGVLLPLATALLSILWTFAGVAWLERSLTLLTVLLAPSLLAIGSVYAVHVLSRYEEALAEGWEAADAVLECQRHMVIPVSIAGGTTIIGFAALLITDVPAVFELGAFAMLGIASVVVNKT